MAYRLAAACLLCASLAWGQEVYSWTDAEGTTHFTDNPAEVPRGVRSHAVQATDVSVLPAERREAPKPPASPPPANPAPKPREDPQKAERTWRRSFQEAYARIQKLEDAVAADAKVVEEVNGLPISAHVRCNFGAVPYPVGTAPASGSPMRSCVAGADPRWEQVRTRLEHNRAELKQARVALDDLERSASAQSVPREWRH